MKKLDKKIKILKNIIPTIERNGDDSNTELFSFYDLLKIAIKEKRKFIIPIYQRKYSWDDDQRQELMNELNDETWSLLKEIDGISWDDIKYDSFVDSYVVKNENIDFDGDNAQTYYGILYLINGNTENRAGYKEYEVVDGQQRITTLYLMLLSLYVYLNYGKNKNVIDSMSGSSDFDGREILSTFISSQLRKIILLDSNKSLSKDNFRLQTLNEIDEKSWDLIFDAISESNNNGLDSSWDISDESFKHYITKNNDILEESNMVNMNIIDGYKFFDNYFRNVAKEFMERGFGQSSLAPNAGAQKDMVINNDIYKTFLYAFVLINGALKSFKIAIFDIVEEASAPIIFETINSKGTPLTSYDILKSKLFKDVDKNDPSYDSEIDRLRKAFTKVEELMKKNYGKNNNVDPKAYDSMLVDTMKFLLSPLKGETSQVSKNTLLDEISDYLSKDNSTNKSEEFINHVIDFNEAYEALWSPNITETKPLFESEDDYLDFLELKNNVDLFKASTFKSLFAGFVARNNEEKSSEDIRKKRNSSYLYVMKRLFSFMVFNWRIKGVKANQFDIPLRRLAVSLKPEDVTKVVSKIALGQESEQVSSDDLISQIIEFNDKSQKAIAQEKTISNDYDNKDILGSYIFDRVWFAENKSEILPNQVNTAKTQRIYKILNPLEAQTNGINLSIADKLGAFFITSKTINASIINRWSFEEFKSPDIKIESLSLDKSIYGDYSVVGKEINEITPEFIEKRNEIIKQKLNEIDIWD